MNEQDRVEALGRLIEKTSMEFFDILANHPERQQEAVKRLLQAHRESLQEAAVDQFSDVPEKVRKKALDEYMASLEKQIMPSLSTFGLTQLTLSPRVTIDDYRKTIFYRLVHFIETQGRYRVALYGRYEVGSNSSATFNSLSKRRASDCYRRDKHDLYIEIRKQDCEKTVRTRRWKFWVWPYYEEVEKMVRGAILGDLVHFKGKGERAFSLFVKRDKLFEEATALANEIAHIFDIEVTVKL